MADKRILIADADSKVLTDFREALGEAWTVVGAPTGNAALEEAHKEAFQVIVANYELPDLKGAELLNRFRVSHPKTLRFIAAAESLKEKVMTDVLHGHQFLAVPFDRETVKNSIERSLAADYGMNNSMRELVGRIRTFPTIPSLYLEVCNALKDPNATTDEIGAIIADDMAMTTKLIQVLNSAYFGLPRTITDPTEAVGILGFETVKSLIMTVKLLSQYDKVKPVYFSIDSIWKHSTNVARTARVMTLLETGDNDCSGVAYTAGLMHDLGKVILATNFDEQYHGAHNVARKQQIPLWEVEKDIFGATHGEIGAYLLSLWGMSQEVVKVAAMHHDPIRAGDKAFSALTAVHVANVLEYEGNADADGMPAPQLDTIYLKELGLEERVELWRVARRDPEQTTMESRAQRAKARQAAQNTTMETRAQRSKATRAVDATTFESKAQRAKTAVRTIDATTFESKAQRAKATAAATAKPGEATASAPAGPVNKFSPPDASIQSARFRGAWKWGSIGIGIAAVLVVLAIRLGNGTPKQEAQNVAENPPPPVKQEVAVVTPPAKPVEAPKPAPEPAPAPATNTAVLASADPPAPAAKPAPVQSALDKLKLQAIFYSSQHPSALINGQLASVDGEVSKCRVLDISPSSVTLGYLDQRRTLTLR
jgi:HD-like signal output (HDOD) protein